MSVGDLFHEWELPYGPVTGLLSVMTRAFTQGSGTSAYETETEGWNTDGDEFLTFTPNIDNRYKLVYTTGMPSVPEDLKQAVLEEILYRYKNKADYEPTAYNVFGMAVEKICQSAQKYAFTHKRLVWQ